MKLRFTRNVAVYGQHREQGSIHDIKDADAHILIADRSAVKVTGDAAPAPIETAELKPAKETATIRKAK